MVASILATWRAIIHLQKEDMTAGQRMKMSNDMLYLSHRLLPHCIDGNIPVVMQRLSLCGYTWFNQEIVGPNTCTLSLIPDPYFYFPFYDLSRHKGICELCAWRAITEMHRSHTVSQSGTHFYIQTISSFQPVFSITLILGHSSATKTSYCYGRVVILRFAILEHILDSNGRHLSR